MTARIAAPPRLVDATLREGFQAPGARFSPRDVTEIARRLRESGADMIEVGHPYVSADAMAHTRSVVDLGLGRPVLAHARAHERDIRAVAASGADWIGIFLGVNDLSASARLNGRGVAEMMRAIREGVGLARALGLKVRFTVEDASRTDAERLATALGTAHDAGADRLCFADSVGALEPAEVSARIAAMRALFPRAELEGHFHDDRGLSMANAMAALDAGADWISVTVNGIGERCGITDHGVLAANLAHRGARALTPAQAGHLAWLCERAARCAGQPLSKSHPVFGEYAFTHTARLHVLATERDQRSYEWMDPARLGRRHETMPLAAPAVAVPDLWKVAGE